MTALRAWPAAALAAAALVSPGGTSYACAAPTVYLDTLTVRVDAKGTYRRGSVAQLAVRVTREVPGVYDGGTAPGDVTLVLTTPAGARLRQLTGTAKDDGRVTLRWRIPPGTTPTRVDAAVTVLHALTPGEECYNAFVYERGTATIRPFTKVVR